jgi:hypothetical protein
MEKELLTLEADLKKYRPMFKNAADAIIEQNVSNYPIFVAHRQSPVIGIGLLDREESNTNWSFNASTLEEFSTKQIIEMSKVDDFRKVYKNPKEFICVFILEEVLVLFIFYPLNNN